MLSLLKTVLGKFARDKCPRMAAALSYYTMFSLAPLLVVCMWIGSWFFEYKQLEGRLSGDLERFLGDQAAVQIQQMIQHASASDKAATLARLASLGVLAFGASGLMLQLQSALNEIWRVTPDKTSSSIKRIVVKRFVSFTMVLLIALLVMASLVVNVWLDMLFHAAESYLVSEVLQILVLIGNSIVSLVMTLALVLLVFKYLPDAQISWRHVTLGAIFTTAMLAVGRWGVGLYLGAKNLDSLYGAAGSLVLVMAFVYYATMILLLGAEFTYAWAHRFGERVLPEAGAMRTDPEKNA